MTRVRPSDPRYPEIAAAVHLLGVAYNPHLWHDVNGTMPELERQATITDIEDWLDGLLNDVPPGAFGEWFDER